jgi:site-specific DNA-cytosine methylase
VKVLLACEESQAVCKEFRKLGHDAFSADIQECSGGHPEWHIQGDVLEILNDDWDMMIAFPPCTDLAVSGAAWFEEKIKDGRQANSREFFMKMINAPIKRIAVENPIGIMSNYYRKPDQIIHPFYFGDPEPKATCLWLKNLPKLQHFPQNDLFNKKTWVEPEYVISSSGKKYSRIHWLGGGSGKERSKFYPGISKAMANQWG